MGKLDIVMPSMYASIFSNIAREYQYDIADEEAMSNDIMDEKLRRYDEMSEQTSEQVDRLSQSTSKAIDAMAHKDEALLQQSLAETRALRKEIEKLKHAVYLDPLTKAYNRKWLEDNFLEENYLLNSDGAMVLVDMNYFKEINDVYGHIVGDKVLIYIANHLRDTDASVVRYGGDELILLFGKEISVEDVVQQMRHSRERILKRKFKSNEDTFKVSFSMGIVPFSQGMELADVIESADVEMYKDKEKIKKRIQGL